MRGIQVIFFIAALWLFSGAFMGFALRVSFGIAGVVPCGSLTVMVGFIWFLRLTQDPREAEVLYGERERGEDEPSSAAGLLAIPIALVVGALFLLLLAPFT